jgi:hypothetical protein
MSSGNAVGEMAALHNKIVSLETEQKMQALKQKMELHVTRIKMEAALEKVKAEAERRTEKAEAERKAEKMKAEAERKAEKMEQRMRHMKMKMEMKAEADKKEMSAKLALLRSEVERKEMQTQIRELELRVITAEAQTAMQQGLALRPRCTQPITTGTTAQHMANPNPPPQQGETEQRLLQQLLERELKLQKTDSSQLQIFPHQITAAPTVQQLVNPHDATMAMTSGVAESMGKHHTAASILQSAQPGATENPQGIVGSAAALSSVTRPAKHGLHHAAQSPIHPHSKTTKPQHQIASAGPAAKAGSVPLPSGARTHFFLSHCQATGGDQTNAIYLELRNLGFSCWYNLSAHATMKLHSHLALRRYDNRATDLTKDGMRHGIEGAAVFLVFLSKGILDRPFCE